MAHPILVGRSSVVSEQLLAIGDSPTDFEIVEPATDRQAQQYALVYHQLRKHKGLSEDSARAAMIEPLTFAAMMVRGGDADVTPG